MPSATDVTVLVKDALIQVIKDLALVSDDGLTDVGQNVVGQMVEDDTNQVFPVVIVTQQGEREEVAEMGFEDDQYWVPFHVYIGDRRSGRDQSLEAVYQWWRSRIRDAFMQDQQAQPIAELGSVGMIEVAFKDVIEADYKKFEYIRSALDVRVYIVIDRDQDI